MPYIMGSDGHTQGIWFGADDRLLTEIKNTAKTTDDSFSSWIKEAAREKLIVDETLEKMGVTFDSNVERRNAIRRAVQVRFGEFDGEFEVKCSNCEKIWAFSTEEKAEQFYSDHEDHTGHPPTRLVEHS